MKGFRDTNPGFDYPWVNFQVMFDMLAAAINKAGSTDALKVALALEDMQAQDIYGQMNTMRKTDHQLLSPFYTAIFHQAGKVRFRKDRLGLEDGKHVHHGRPHLPLQLQNEAARRGVGERRIR